MQVIVQADLEEDVAAATERTTGGSTSEVLDNDALTGDEAEKIGTTASKAGLGRVVVPPIMEEKLRQSIRPNIDRLWRGLG